jgi:hypothetical protein
MPARLGHVLYGLCVLIGFVLACAGYQSPKDHIDYLVGIVIVILFGASICYVLAGFGSDC